MLSIIMMSSFSEPNISLVTEKNVQELYEITASMPSAALPDWGYTVAAAVLFFIGFFGFFLNLFVIVLMCKDMQVSVIEINMYNAILFNNFCSLTMQNRIFRHLNLK